jgi:hypothetical protein
MCDGPAEPLVLPLWEEECSSKGSWRRRLSQTQLFREEAGAHRTAVLEGMGLQWPLCFLELRESKPGQVPSDTLCQRTVWSLLGKR